MYKKDTAGPPPTETENGVEKAPAEESPAAEIEQVPAAIPCTVADKPLGATVSTIATAVLEEDQEGISVKDAPKLPPASSACAVTTID